MTNAAHTAAAVKATLDALAVGDAHAKAGVAIPTVGAYAAEAAAPIRATLIQAAGRHAIDALLIFQQAQALGGGGVAATSWEEISAALLHTANEVDECSLGVGSPRVDAFQPAIWVGAIFYALQNPGAWKAENTLSADAVGVSIACSTGPATTVGTAFFSGTGGFTTQAHGGRLRTGSSGRVVDAFLGKIEVAGQPYALVQLFQDRHVLSLGVGDAVRGALF